MDYKNYFDIPEGLTYLNTPGNGLMPKTHYEWRRQWDTTFFDPCSDLRDQQTAFITEVKAEMGGLFNCPADHIYAVPNFSFGYNTLLNGLPRGMSFVLLEEEYPSLHYPIVSRGFRHKVISTQDGELEQNIRQVISRNKPDVFLLSIVQYISGLKIDLEFIKELKCDFPDLIIIGDATQYLGTEPFNFAASGFDAIGGSGYKWLMAGFGNGYIMLSDRLKAILYPNAQTQPRPVEAMWSHKSIIDTFFEPGHQDTLSHGTLLESIRFLKQLGLNPVKSHIDEVNEYAYEQFIERNWILPIVENRSSRSSLINLQVPPESYPLLLKKGIKCFPRGKGVRIGIHLYNDKNDIDYLVKILDKRIIQ